MTRDCEEIEPLFAPFVDGDADAADRTAVEGHLASCPACAVRLQAERASHAVLRARRETLRVKAPAALRARCTPSASRHGRLTRGVPLSLAASLMLAVAGAVVFSITDPVRALAASVAADHVKCFALHDASAVANAEDIAREWLRDEGWTLPVPAARPDLGIRFLGIRHCLSSEGFVAHLLYTVSGERVSVFVWKNVGQGRHDVESLGQRAIIWSSAEHMVAVVGDADAAVLARMVDHVQKSVN